MKNISILSNGLHVVTDYIDHVETVSLGAWVGIGARYEKETVNGISHVLEHMAFKGTTTRKSFEIADAIESVGGYLNAYTSRETTAYYTRLLKEHSSLGVEIICDILSNSTFNETELKKEKHVIIQEIGQTEDSPDDIVFDYFQSTCFKDQAMGRSILGPVSNVENFTSHQVKNYMQDHYSTNNMVFAAAGKIDHDRFVEDVENKLSSFKKEATVFKESANYTGGDFRLSKELEQAHVIIGLLGVGYGHNDYYRQMLASIILGGGMSSRLFQEIREKRGLVYGISAFASPYTDCGIFSIYAGTGAHEVKELIPLTVTELFKMTGSVSQKELNRAKSQLKASLMMGLESTSNRCERIANQILIHKRFIETSEVIQKIDDIKTTDIQDFMNNLLKGVPTLTTLGPIENVIPYDDFLNTFEKRA
ncbi:MAG: insulinase family protein [Proteobacteria bacterium]|nr:insulinase family protein [Pseudomonadota bacterium]